MNASGHLLDQHDVIMQSFEADTAVAPVLARLIPARDLDTDKHTDDDDDEVDEYRGPFLPADMFDYAARSGMAAPCPEDRRQIPELT